MSMPLIKPAWVLSLALLTACASTGPTPKSAQSTPAAAQALNVDPQIAAQYHRAVQILKTGAGDEALAQFNAIVAKAPQLSGAYLNIGLIHLQKKRYAEAEIAFNQAINANATHAVAQNYLGVALREQGKFDKAEQAYQRALQLDDSYADAHLNLGILYDIYLNDLPRALEQYEKYQSLTNNKDEQVTKWIADIKLRQSKTK
ncbi:MAG: tetratricopeptide repeat protein [Gammaproteobacteria bacterium]|nr:tetratricopeptide repeat protein [Gammaproteobacteria bacterium]